MPNVHLVDEKATKKSKFMVVKRVFTKEGVNPLDTVKWVKRDAVILNAEGEEVARYNGTEVPEWWSDTQVNVAADKYLRVVNGVRETSMKQVFHRVAFFLAYQGIKQGIFEGETVETDDSFKTPGLTGPGATIFYDELIYMFVHGMFAFNSPVWFNVGVVARPQCSACFIQGVEDSMESILELSRKEVMLFKGGSGTGSNISKLRSSYEKLSGGGWASGPVSFMQGYDAFAGATKSGGTTRRAAKMVILNIDHPDILEQKNGAPGFIRCKADAEQVAHDLYSTGKYTAEFNKPGNVYDRVPYQNANNSVRVTDEFMKAVEDDEEWHTRSITTGEIVHTYKARKLWREIAEATWVCGDPGLQFDTTTNEWHTCGETGRINASNPCSEYLFLDDTACNLSSLNLLKFSKGKQFMLEEFKHACKLAITGMEILVDASSYPSEQIEKNSHLYRTLGLGYTNLGSLLTYWGLPYDSNDGRAVAGAITAIMGGVAQSQSALLAEIRGPFELFTFNKNSMMDVIAKHLHAARQLGYPKEKCWRSLTQEAIKVWILAEELGQTHGYRNAQVTVLAPTGTISFLMGAETTGIEPNTAIVKYKRLVGGGILLMTSSIVEPALKHLGYTDDQIAKISAYIKENGTIHGAPEFNEERHGSVFAEALGTRAMRPEAHVLMMAAVQPFISGGISKTVNVPSSATAEDMERIYMLAWKSGLKCIALYRDGCKLSQPISTKLKKEGKKEADSLKWGERRRLPDHRKSDTFKFDIGGQEGYLTVGLYPDGRPGELFIRMAKQGSTLNGVMDGFATAVSIALQQGTPLELLVEKFSDLEFEPKGFTNHGVIKRARSIFDFIFQLLALVYLKESRHLLRTHDMDLPDEAEEPSQESSQPNPEKATNTSYDGPPCTRCGNMTKRSGSCYVCVSCGQTSGCS